MTQPRSNYALYRLLRRSLWFNIFLVLLICVIFYLVFFSSLGWITRHGAEEKVPNVTGKSVRAAVQTLEGLDFEVKVDSTFDPTKKPLIVLQQLPDVGDVVKNGRTLFLTVNKAVPPTTPMPNLVNLSFRSAVLILQSNRLVLGDTTFRPDIAKGAILEQLYMGQPIRPGQLIPQGSRISLVIGNGLGVTDIAVPDVIGMDPGMAVASLNGNNLQVVPVYDPGITDTGTFKVYNQVPAPMTDLGAPSRIRVGDEVTIFIGQNPSDSLMDHYRNAWRAALQRQMQTDTSRR